MEMSNLPMNRLGIGGAAAMAVRNIAMSLGVAVTSAILYGGMSKYLGYNVTDYVGGGIQDAAFVYGMRLAYFAAALLCVFGIAASIFRAKKISAA